MSHFKIDQETKIQEAQEKKNGKEAMVSPRDQDQTDAIRKTLSSHDPEKKRKAPPLSVKNEFQAAINEATLYANSTGPMQAMYGKIALALTSISQDLEQLPKDQLARIIEAGGTCFFLAKQYEAGVADFMGDSTLELHFAGDLADAKILRDIVRNNSLDLPPETINRILRIVSEALPKPKTDLKTVEATNLERTPEEIAGLANQLLSQMQNDTRLLTDMEGNTRSLALKSEQVKFEVEKERLELLEGELDALVNWCRQALEKKNILLPYDLTNKQQVSVYVQLSELLRPKAPPVSSSVTNNPKP